jgi:hypothetical protein
VLILPEKKKQKKRVENDSEEEGQSSECVSHSITLLCADTTWVREGLNTGILQPAGKFILPGEVLNISQKQLTYRLFLKIDVGYVKYVQ